MFEPISSATLATAEKVAAKTAVAKNVASTVTAGEDPSLTELATSAYIARNPLDTTTSTDEILSKFDPVAEEYIIDSKEITNLPDSEYGEIIEGKTEKYVDKKYLKYGNLSEAWANVKSGQLTFQNFYLAIVDVIDMLTLGLARPALLEIKINPHIKTREVFYQAEVEYSAPETVISANPNTYEVSTIEFSNTPNQSIIDPPIYPPSPLTIPWWLQILNVPNYPDNIDSPPINSTISTTNSNIPADAVVSDSTTVAHRYAKITKITFEVGAEAFDDTELAFSEAVNKINSSELADRTIIYTRLDQLTTQNLEMLSEEKLENIQSQSERVTSVEIDRELTDAEKKSPDQVLASGGTLISDDETILTEINKETSNIPILPQNNEILIDRQNQSETGQSVRLQGRQIENIDHMAGTKEVQSQMTKGTENIRTESSTNSLRKDTDIRIQEAEGNIDLRNLEVFSMEAYQNHGGVLISDKGLAENIIVAVDHHDSGETINFIGSDSKRSFLAKKKDITYKQSEQTINTRERIGTQITAYDYLENSKEILEKNIQETNTTEKIVKDITETDAYWAIGSVDFKNSLGVNTTTATTPTVSTTKETKAINLTDRQNLENSLTKSTGSLQMEGATLSNQNTHTSIQHELEQIEKSFKDGYIDHIPLIGGLTHLGSKVALGGDVGISDAFWAAADVAEIAIIIGSLGAATPLVTGGKAAVKETVKAGSKTLIKSGTKGALKSQGKATIHGSIKGLENYSKRIASKIPKGKDLKQLVIDNKTRPHLPKNTGKFLGEPGYSLFKPFKKIVPKGFNPNNLNWEQILKKYKIDGIPFINGSPDFSKVAIEKVTIRDFGKPHVYGKKGATAIRQHNFKRADQALAKQWCGKKVNPYTKSKNWNQKDVARFRKGHNYTWHENYNMKDLELVPREIHDNIPHSGGVSRMINQSEISRLGQKISNMATESMDSITNF